MIAAVSTRRNKMPGVTANAPPAWGVMTDNLATVLDQAIGVNLDA
jgi:hypothetical protein